MGRTYLKRHRIQVLIEAAQRDRGRRMGLSADRVIEELWHIAGLDIGDLYQDDGTLRPISDMTETARRAVSGIETFEEFDKDGDPVGTTRKTRTWDKVQALALLAKHFGLIVDRKELSGPKGGPIEVTGDIKAMTTEELLAEKERLLADT
jgi:phage terminase small subunit